ncbi:hypothetical protein [Butyrivibrio sp. FC2001]|uniref:hypothetical protein n=1 Tax=Butyrivibrio sp. FC2001 TaxID=1280671 RepID=UPI001A98640A|nr:hypothetical protein [Butyrivibrio sp. FC2001]
MLETTSCGKLYLVGILTKTTGEKYKYLDAYVKVPEIKGKITFRKNGNTPYVEFEYDGIYSMEKQYMDVRRKNIIEGTFPL